MTNPDELWVACGVDHQPLREFGPKTMVVCQNEHDAREAAIAIQDERGRPFPGTRVTAEPLSRFINQ